jgi:hypothetical protein
MQVQSSLKRWYLPLKLHHITFCQVVMWNTHLNDNIKFQIFMHSVKIVEEKMHTFHRHVSEGFCNLMLNFYYFHIYILKI